MIANPLGFEPAEDSIPQQANPLGFDPVPDQPEPPATPTANPLGFAVADDAPDELGIGQEVRGTGRALVRGVLRADQAVTALGADRNIDALTTLTSELAKAREAVTAFDQEAQANPRFGASGSAWRQSQVARIAGMEQEIARRQWQVAQAFPRLARREQQAAALPPSPDLANLGTDFWQTLATNPVETIASVVAESLPQAIPGTLAGAALGGPVGAALGAGSNSLAIEYANTLLESARQAGVSVQDPQAVAQWFSDPSNLEAARARGLKRGVPVATFDALTAGLAGRFLAPAVGQGMRPVAAASAKELGVQAAGGMAGETAGQLVSQGRITSVPDIVLEGIAELGTAPGEVAGNLRAEWNPKLGPVELPAVEFTVADRADDELPGDFVAPPVVPVDEAVAAPSVLDDQAAAPPPPPAEPVDDQSAAPAPPVETPPPDGMSVPAAEVVAAPAPPAAPVADATVDDRGAPQSDALTFGNTGATVSTTPAGSAVSAETITGSNEQTGSEMPAEREERPTRARARKVRPDEVTLVDIIKEYGKSKISLKQFREADPRWQPPASLRRYFSANSGVGADQVMSDAQQRGIINRDITAADQFGDEISKAWDQYKGRASQEKQQRDSAEILGRQFQAFDQRIVQGNRPKSQQKSIEQIASSDLYVGDKFTAQGEKFTVTDVSTDDDGYAIEATVRDGPKFGEQRVDVQESPILTIDKGSLQRSGDQSGGKAANRILAKLDELDRALDVGPFADPLLLTPLAKLAIKIAKLLVRGGMALQDAIVEAVKRARQEIPDAQDDADALAQAMTSALNVRQFSERVDEAPDVPDPVKQAVENRLYVRKPNEDTATFAGRVMDAVGGPAPAIAVFTDQTNGLGGAERSMLGMLILKRLAAAGDHEGAAKFMDDYLAGYSTDAAQSLQAFAAFGQLTPQGALFYAKRQIDKASAGIKGRLKPVIQQVVGALNDINQAGINNAAAAPDVQKAAGALIESSLVDEANGPGTVHDALMIELTNSLDQMRGAREARAKAGAAWLLELGGQTYWGGIVRSSAKALANQLARQTGASVATVQQLASDMAKAMLDQINAAIGTPAQQRPQAQSWASRLATLMSNREKAQELWTAARQALAAKYADNPKVMAAIAGDFTVYGPSLLRAVLNEQLQALDISLAEVVRTHYRFAGDGANLRDKLIARLGLSPDQAQALAKDYDALIQAEYQKLQSKLAARVAAVKRDDRFRRMMRSGVVSADMLPENELDRVLALELRARRLALGKIIREHYTRQQAAGQDLAQSIAGALGVDPAMAATVADAIRRRFEANVRDAKAKAVERIAKAVPGVSRGQKQAWQRIVELSNLGALDSEQAWQAVAERLKLPRWTTTISQEVTRRADEIQRAPDGLPRQQKVIELHNYLARTAGVSAIDLGMAFWYSNMLSGPVTQFLNLWANTLNLMTNTVMAARHPRDVWPQVVAVFRGAARGGRDAAAVLRTGINTRTGDIKLEASKPLELVRLPGKADFILTPWRLVGRGLAAGDALFFRSGQEMRAVLLARQMARAEGLRGPDLERRVRLMLAEDSSQRAAAMQQATSEGLTGNEWSRRVDDILTRQRPEDLRANSRDYALKLTFNNKPYGLMGALANGINWIGQQPMGWPVRLVVPFTNVIANVVNESLNYTPVGLGRAIYGQWSGDLDGKPISDPNALGDQYAKAATGTLLLALIAMAKASGEDQDDPWFDVSGSGPNTAARRNQLRSSGWIPYGVKVNGRWVSYANSPLAIPLAMLGNFYDARRYRGLDERTAFDRLAWALFNFGKVITDQSFLDGVAGLFSTFDRESTAGGEQLMRQFGRTATTAVIPNALRQIDRMFDPTVYDAPSATAALVASVPFARRANRRTLNVWGEPVSNPVTKRFTSPQGDPMAQELARMGLWISAPRAEDVKLRGEPVTDAQFYEFTRVRGQRLRQMLEARGVMANLRQLPAKARASVWDRYQSAARAQALAAAARVRD